MQKQIRKDEKVQAVNKPFNLKIVDASDAKIGRGGKNGNGVRYPKYDIAIAPHVGWLQSAISESKDGVIRVRVKDVAKEMGSDFVKKNPTSIYWGLKYVLFFRGIIVDSGTLAGDEKLLVMRARVKGDRLPPSLDKIKKPDVVVSTGVDVVPKAESEVTVDVIQPENMIRGMKRIVTAIRLSEIESDLPEGEVQA